MTMTLDPMHTIQHTAELAMTFAPRPSDPFAAPFAQLRRIAGEQRARLEAIAPTVTDYARADLEAGAVMTTTARQLTAVLWFAACAGLAVLPHDPQGEVFGALLDTFLRDTDLFGVALSIEPHRVDLALFLTKEPTE